MRITWGCLLIGLAACDSERLSSQEARETFEAVNELTNEVVWSARDTIEQGSRTQLDVAEEDGTFDISGVVQPPDARGKGPRGWTGTMELSGEVTEDGDRLVYGLEMLCVGLTPSEGPTLDGALEITFTVDTALSEDLLWSLGVSVQGELDVSGTSTGHASIDYDLALKIDGFSIAFEAHGTINGYNVSDWSYAFSL